MYSGSSNFKYQKDDTHISIPKIAPNGTVEYSIEGLESFDEPIGYTCNVADNFRQSEYQTYCVIDPDSCQVLKEIVYINSTPRAVQATNVLKGSRLTGNVYGVPHSQQVFPKDPYVIYDPTSNFRCPDCDEIVGCECQFYLHKLLYHASLSSLDILKCEICGKISNRVSSFKSHLSLHVLRNDLLCSRCYAKVPNSTSQDDINDKVVPVSSNQYRCRLCGTVNSSLTELRIHYKQNHPKKDCSTTSNQQQMDQEEITHSIATRRICKDHASDFIKRITSLSKYGKRKTSASNSISGIDLSEYTKKVAITKKRPNFLCIFCSKKFPSNTLAKYHVLSHRGVKPLCSLNCSEKFSQRRVVVTHMASYDKPKSFSCPYCEKFFNFQQNLDFHVTKSHKVVASMEKSLQVKRELSNIICIISYGRLSKPLLSLFNRFLSLCPLFTRRRLPCKYCFMTFGSFSVRIVHETTVHFKRSRCPRRPLRISAVYKRHREKLNHISKLLSSPQSPHCPWCSLHMASPKFHFVSHFLSDAFICGECGRRFVISSLCLLHMRKKHRKVKSNLRVLIRCDIPRSVLQRIGLLKRVNFEVNPTTKDKNIPFEIINLAEQQQGYTYTKQLDQEIVWLTETQPKLSQAAPEVDQIPDSKQPVIQSFVSDQGFQSDVTFLYPQENLDTYYSKDVAYLDHAASGFDADNQLTVEFVPPGLNFNSGKVAIVADPQLSFQPQEGGLSDFFGCCQCTARFDCSLALSSHAATHQTTSRYYCVCCKCGWNRLDSGETELCQACGNDTFQQLGLMKGDGLIGFARFYCAHCNVAFTDLDQLEFHISELYMSQPQPIVEEFVTVEKIHLTTSPQNTFSQTHPAIEAVSSRQPNLPKQQHFQLSEVELDRILQTQPTPESSLSERLVYEAAYERNFRSYPTAGKRETPSSSSSKDRPYVCTICSYRFLRSSDLHRHMLLHTGVRPYACKFCDKRFILSRRLLAHASNYHGSEGAAWATGFLSGRPRSRKFPQTSTSPESLNCHLCGAKLNSVSSLRTHMRIHTGTKTYTCPCCNISFRTPIQRKRHLKVCQKSRQTDIDATSAAQSSFDFTPFLLDLQQPLQPPQPSTSTSGLRDLVTDHSQQQNVCLEPEQRTSLNSFVNLWQCRNCQKTFNSNKAFTNHQCIILHRLYSKGVKGITVERCPFTCSVCNHRFTRRNDLKRHERTHETNEMQKRPFSCGACGARFTQSGSLNIHLRSTGHDGTSIPRRRFRCRLCGSAFFYRSGLIRHSANDHGVRSIEDDTEG